MKLNDEDNYDKLLYGMKHDPFVPYKMDRISEL